MEDIEKLLISVSFMSSDKPEADKDVSNDDQVVLDEAPVDEEVR